MDIWIVDDNISFAFGLKQQILKSLIFTELACPGSQVLVLRSAHDFWKEHAKQVKDSNLAPCLVFLEVYLPDENGLNLYMDIKEKYPPFSEKIIFYSALAHGRYEAFFAGEDEVAPPFYEKNFLEKKLDEILRGILKKTKGKTSPVPYSILKKNGEILEMALDDLKKNFYEGKFFSQSAQQMASFIEGITKHAQNFGLALIEKQAGDLLSLLTRKRMPGVMRLKKEIRDLLALKETEFQEWKKKVGLPTWKKHE